MKQPLKHKYTARYMEGLRVNARFEVIASGWNDCRKQCRAIKKQEGIRGMLHIKFIEKI